MSHGLRSVTQGLRLFPAMIIVPLMQIAWALFSIISGMLYFEEYKTFTTLGAIMFALGVVVSAVQLLGSLVASSSNSNVQRCVSSSISRHIA